MLHQQKKYRYIVLLAVILVLSLFLSGCGEKEEAEQAVQPNEPFTASTSAYEDGGRIDIKHTLRDQNISIPITWSNAPADTKSFAIIMYDLHEIAGNWVHWAVKDIPANITGLPEGVSGTDQLPTGSKELRNTFGSTGYGGPQPPKGSGDHEYKIIVYALNTELLEIADNPSFKLFEKLVEPFVLASAEFSGFYENK